MAKLSKILIVCLIVLLARLAIAVPAQAIEKERETEVIDLYWENDYYCDFTLAVRQVGTVKYTYIYNQDGFSGFRGVDTNYRHEVFAKGHPEKALKIHFQGPASFQDLNEDGSVWFEKWVGQSQHVTIPGYGSVLGRAGNVTLRGSSSPRCRRPARSCRWLTNWLPGRRQSTL